VHKLHHSDAFAAPLTLTHFMQLPFPGSMSERSYNDEHEAFAASRSQPQFVYVPVNDHYFAELDKHIETDIQLPLVVVGEPGKNNCAN
jgi:hypothetical protein